MTDIHADYIIIGAGSAGCVIANRLSANPKNHVILLEAGGKDWNPWIHIPVGYFKTMHNPSVDWCYQTEADSGINNRRLDWPRGKVLGGSSSLNGLLYVRGQAEDYQRWAQMGNKGWAWDDVLPFFKKSESQENGANDFHDTQGELKVSNGRIKRPICDAWVEAAQQVGYPFNPDYNGATQEGVGYFQLTSDKGRRCSSAVAFLHPVKNRPNLQLITKAQTQKIIIENNIAKGLIYRDASGKLQKIFARREIVISAGTLGSPHILMHSGIGAADELKPHNIEVVKDLPGVGKNLQDHLQARLVLKCNEATLNDEVRSALSKVNIALRYAMFRTGPMTMAASLAFGFIRTHKNLLSPDIQFHIQPWSADSPGKGVHPFSAFTMSVCQLRPESRGYLQLVSGDPMDYPKIHPCYLSTDIDKKTITQGVKIARKIGRTQPLAGKIAEEFKPNNNLPLDDDEGTLEWIKNNSVSIYHPTGTCKMGADKMAVVDERLRVHGIKGLRVADCSIMPEIVSGNTNAPAIMIGEKLSAMVLEDNRG